MFVNPGGPGQSGVELVLDGGADFDAWGDGRFDIVGWDPRGTNDSSPVQCFTSDDDRGPVLGGRVDPIHRRPSRWPTSARRSTWRGGAAR